MKRLSIQKKYLPPAAFILATLLSRPAFATQAEDFAKLSPQAAIELSHQWNRTGDARVSVSDREITAQFKDGSETTIALGELFFVSIAPWKTVTHPCGNHVPTSCRGELVGAKMKLIITDQTSGEVYSERQVSLQDDGFLDLWLPRNKRFIVRFEDSGEVAEQIIETGAGSQTCITTMQFKTSQAS